MFEGHSITGQYHLIRKKKTHLKQGQQKLTERATTPHFRPADFIETPKMEFTDDSVDALMGIDVSQYSNIPINAPTDGLRGIDAHQCSKMPINAPIGGSRGINAKQCSKRSNASEGVLDDPTGALRSKQSHQTSIQLQRSRKIKVSSWISLEMKRRMDRHPQINWSQIMRDSINGELQVLEGNDRNQDLDKIASPK
jgi:hypothetical protein